MNSNLFSKEISKNNIKGVISQQSNEKTNLIAGEHQNSQNTQNTQNSDNKQINYNNIEQKPNTQSQTQNQQTQAKGKIKNRYTNDKCDLEKYLEFGFPFNKCDTMGQY